MNPRPRKSGGKQNHLSRNDPRHITRGRAGRGAGPQRPPAPRKKVTPIDPASIIAPESTIELLARWPECAEDLKTKLAEFIAFLLETNQLFNMTGDSTPEKQWGSHVNDTLQAATLMEEEFQCPAVGMKILDVGSGGGVPGLIFALLWPEAAVHLLEAVGKKALFLREAARRLNLPNVEVIAERAELAAHSADRHEHYDWVTARALAPLPVLAEWTLPFAKLGGRVFAIKGDALDEEIKSAKRASKLLGAPEPPQLIPYTRPDGKVCHLVVYKKIDKTPSLYPRRAGSAPNSPL